MVDENQTGAQMRFEQSFESSDEGVILGYKTPFMDHTESESKWWKKTGLRRKSPLSNLSTQSVKVLSRNTRLLSWTVRRVKAFILTLGRL